ncbi:MAG: NAD(P)/FAD-dependent oxidoreductase [Nitrososphaerales archaeon]
MDSGSGEPILVIGGGSTGSSTAYCLAKTGEKVVLVDRDQVASGMTSKSTALVRTHYSNEIVARMALYSLRIFERTQESGFVNNGMLILGTEEAKDAIDSNLEMLSSVGVKSESLARIEAEKRFPEIDFEGAASIVFEPESGYADPVATANYYARTAREFGAVVLLGEGVSRLHAKDGKLSAVELSGGKLVECSKAILCTNVWTNTILSRSGVEQDELLPLWAAAHPVMILKRPQSYGGMKPSIMDIQYKTYYKPEGRSLFLAGSLDPELDKQHVDPESPPAEVSFEFMNFFSKAIVNRIPVMREGTLHSSYIGMYDMTPDQHPIIDSLSSLGFEGLYCCVGLSGHGFKLCPALGQMNAEMIMPINSSTERFDRSFFSLDRFGKGREFKTRYSDLGTVA